nr:hypothetical protein [Mameliella alba]
MVACESFEEGCANLCVWLCLAVILQGTGNDCLIGGGDNDTLNGKAGDDTPFGGEDVLEDDEGNNILRGRAGSDELAGGPGRDFLTDGQNAEILVFRAWAEAVVGADHDQILDFEQGLDSIVVAGLLPGVCGFRGSAAFSPSGNLELRRNEAATRNDPAPATFRIFVRTGKGPQGPRNCHSENV